MVRISGRLVLSSFAILLFFSLSPVFANTAGTEEKAGAVPAEWQRYSFKLERETIVNIGPKNLNDILNSKSQFPVMPHPKDVVVNRENFRHHVTATLKYADYDSDEFVANIQKFRFITEPKF